MKIIAIACMNVVLTGGRTERFLKASDAYTLWMDENGRGVWCRDEKAETLDVFIPMSNINYIQWTRDTVTHGPTKGKKAVKD